MNLQQKDALATELATSLLRDAPDNETLVATVRGRIGCSDDEARDIVYDAAAQVNALLFPPLTQLELVLTEGCNLGCAYCFEKDMLGYRRMPLDVARRAVDMLILYSRDKRDLDIAHFGGEPTLSFRTVQAVTEYAQQRAAAAGKRIDFNMTTNGVLLNEDIAAYCAGHDIRVLLSIDGGRAAHDRYRVDKRGAGTFDRAIRGLRILKRFQPWIGIKMTVMPDNVGHLADDVRMLHDLGVNQFTIGHATGVAWSDDDMIAYVAALQDVRRWYDGAKGSDLRIDDIEDDGSDAAYFGCQAGRSSISVSVDGQISPCSKVLALNNRTLLAKLGDVWCGLTHIANRADIVGCGKLKSACETQGIASDYQGGCFVSNYNETGSLFRPSMMEHRLAVMQKTTCAGCGARG